MLEEVYQRNIELDEIFFNNYGNDNLTFKKNCVELLVELGEFINETKCFKYWSTKEPNKDLVLEELADVITMLMYFANLNKMSVAKYKVTENNEDLFVLINETYLASTKLMEDMSEDNIDKIFVLIYKIAYILDIKDDEIVDAIKKKHEIIYERLNSDY